MARAKKRGGKKKGRRGRPSAEFKRRSEAAKRGWKTRRENEIKAGVKRKKPPKRFKPDEWVDVIGVEGIKGDTGEKKKGK